jgi:hypothetical protein
MRRVWFILLVYLALGLAIAVPGALAAYPAGAAGGGSLAVRGANGSLVVKGQGVIFGYLDQGSLYVFYYDPNNVADAISVEGASPHNGSGITLYSGSQVRFLIPAGSYTLELVGTGIDVSAVGRGMINVSANGNVSAGTVALDGGRPASFSRVAVPASFGGVSP